MLSFTDLVTVLSRLLTLQVSVYFLQLSILSFQPHPCATSNNVTSTRLLEHSYMKPRAANARIFFILLQQ
jgi:hypothetical protein